MSAPQIAIGSNGKVSIWASVTRRHPDGRISFDVYNGAWRGSIKDGVVHVNATKADFPAEILWQGRAPMSGYNDVIPWIEQQIKEKP